MSSIEMKVIGSLPAVRSIADDPAMSEDLYTEAAKIAARVYEKHFGLSGDPRAARLRICYPNPVAYVGENGQEQQAFGMLMGPAKGVPTLTVLVPLDGSQPAMVCAETIPWVRQFGVVLLPSGKDPVTGMTIS